MGVPALTAATAPWGSPFHARVESSVEQSTAEFGWRHGDYSWICSEGFVAVTSWRPVFAGPVALDTQLLSSQSSLLGLASQ